jgi:hypothetical protein
MFWPEKGHQNGAYLYNVAHSATDLQCVLFHEHELGSLVSIVSDYGLDDQASIPNRGRGFFL